MKYRIDVWTERGITYQERDTKREANLYAERARGEQSTAQTVVTKPNGDVRICRNTKRKL